VMLLYLFFLISLVVAQAPPDECSTKYRCYSPNDCTKTSGADLNPVTTTPSDPSCFVFLKFHPYVKGFYRVRMETAAGNTKIELIHTTDSSQNKKEKLTCTVDANGKVTATKTVVNANDPPTDIVLLDKNKDKLMCEFEIGERVPNAPISKDDFLLSKMKAIVYGADSTTKSHETTENTATLKVYCVPGVFPEPREKFEADKKYAKVQYNWRDDSKWENGVPMVYCDQPEVYSTIEYFKEDADVYKKVDKIHCEPGFGYKLKLEGETAMIDPLVEDFDLRCVADAEYFCDYDPKAPSGKQKLTRIAPDLSTRKKASVECPDEFPYFVMKGRLPVHKKDAEKIKCLNHYGKMRWTYSGTLLTENGPEVHCIKDLDCNVMNKLTRDNLKGTFLDNKNQPTCQSGGQKKVSEGTYDAKGVKDYKNLISVECDPSGGKYYYKQSGSSQKHQVNSKTTFFSCYYEDKTQEGNVEASKKIFHTIGIVAGAVTAIAIAITVSIICWMKQKMNKLNKQILDKKNTFNSTRFKHFEDDEKMGVDQNDLLANDYLHKKREEANKTVLYKIYDEKV
ncbi:hypothetical protein PFISCL1PPCAC_26031, partial [Pristionchus fissidentatus]